MIFARLPVLIVFALALGSCEPAEHDIRVVWRNGRLAIDSPWTVWNVIGRGRSYCLSRIELFDSNALLWTLDIRKDGPSCIDLDMPIPLGTGAPRFESTGRPRLHEGVRYGVATYGLGRGRVDFVIRGREPPVNFTDRRRQIEPPAGSQDRARLESPDCLQTIRPGPPLGEIRILQESRASCAPGNAVLAV